MIRQLRTLSLVQQNKQHHRKVLLSSFDFSFEGAYLRILPTDHLHDLRTDRVVENGFKTSVFRHDQLPAIHGYHDIFVIHNLVHCYKEGEYS